MMTGWPAIARKNSNLLPLILALALSAPVLAQQAYRCTDDEGRPVFQQTPCADAESEAITVDTRPMGVDAAGSRPGEQAMLQRFRHRIDAETRTIRIGMTEQEARRAWGAPDRINRSSGGDQWVYRREGERAQYLYFRNGILTSFN